MDLLILPGHEFGVLKVGFSPDSNRIFSLGAGQRAWDARTGTLLLEGDVPLPWSVLGNSKYRISGHLGATIIVDSDTSETVARYPAAFYEFDHYASTLTGVSMDGVHIISLVGWDIHQ